MGTRAKPLQNRFLPIATAFAAAWLAGSANADAVTPAAAGAGAAPGIAYAAGFGGNTAMAGEVFIFVTGLLLVTLLCFGWLVYLMLKAPAEKGQDPAAQPGIVPEAEHHGIGETIRARLGSLLGHAGPV